MKKMKTTIVVAAVALGAMAYSAHASIVLSGSSTYQDHNNPGYDLTIGYTVDQTADALSLSGYLYTYTYTLTTSPDEGLSSFTLSTYTPTALITEVGSGSTYAAVQASQIVWDWDATSATYSEEVQFTSDYAPGWFAFGVNDSGKVWNNPPLIPAAAPVPEASTLVAGALMLLPLGLGAARALRKERTV